MARRITASLLFEAQVGNPAGNRAVDFQQQIAILGT